MDEKIVKKLYESINNLQSIVETNKENNTKVLIYLVNQTNEINKVIASIKTDIDVLKEFMSNTEDFANKVDEEFDNVDKEQKDNIEQTNKKIKSLSNEINDYSKIVDSIQEFINDNIIYNKTDYIVIKKSEIESKWIKRLKEKLYVFFHYRKIKKKETEELLLRKQQEEEKKLLEQQLAKEEKKKKEEKIRNILAGTTKK